MLELKRTFLTKYIKLKFLPLVVPDIINDLSMMAICTPPPPPPPPNLHVILKIMILMES